MNPSFPQQRYREDPTVLQAIDMGHVIGQRSTVEQIVMYSRFRKNEIVLDSDQVVWARVLGLTGGPSDDFKAHYPNIDFQSSPGLDEAVGKFLKEIEVPITAR